MAPATPKLSDYKLESIKPLHSADGSKCNLATVRYVKKNPSLSIKGCISASGSK